MLSRCFFYKTYSFTNLPSYKHKMAFYSSNKARMYCMNYEVYMQLQHFIVILVYRNTRRNNSTSKLIITTKKTLNLANWSLKQLTVLNFMIN